MDTGMRDMRDESLSYGISKLNKLLQENASFIRLLDLVCVILTDLCLFILKNVLAIVLPLSSV